VKDLSVKRGGKGKGEGKRYFLRHEKPWLLFLLEEGKRTGGNV